MGLRHLPDDRHTGSPTVAWAHDTGADLAKTKLVNNRAARLTVGSPPRARRVQMMTIADGLAIRICGIRAAV